jgi:hypothetical protein
VVAVNHMLGEQVDGELEALSRGGGRILDLREPRHGTPPGPPSGGLRTPDRQFAPTFDPTLDPSLDRSLDRNLDASLGRAFDPAPDGGRRGGRDEAAGERSREWGGHGWLGPSDAAW